MRGTFRRLPDRPTRGERRGGTEKRRRRRRRRPGRTRPRTGTRRGRLQHHRRRQRRPVGDAVRGGGRTGAVPAPAGTTRNDRGGSCFTARILNVINSTPHPWQVRHAGRPGEKTDIENWHCLYWLCLLRASLHSVYFIRDTFIRDSVEISDKLRDMIMLPWEK